MSNAFALVGCWGLVHLHITRGGALERCTYLARCLLPTYSTLSGFGFAIYICYSNIALSYSLSAKWMVK